MRHTFTLLFIWIAIVTAPPPQTAISQQPPVESGSQLPGGDADPADSDGESPAVNDSADDDLADDDSAGNAGDAAEQDSAKLDTVDGKITEVTLYRDSALVTRSIEMDEKADEIIVDDLPEQLVTSSVFAEGAEGVTIRGVRVISTPTDQSTRAEVQRLDQLIEDNQEAVAAAEKQLEVAGELADTVDAMVNFSTVAAASDLQRGVLDADSLLTVVTAAGERREEIATRTLDIQRELKALRKTESKLDRERQQLTARTPLNRYQARVFLSVDDDAKPEFRLRYSAGGCSWTPQYSVSASTESDQVEIRYGAVITQTSGEDWNDVGLTLSTASPSVSAAGPTLVPMRVTTGSPGNEPQLDDLFGANEAADDMAQSMGGMGEMDGGMGMTGGRSGYGSALPSQMSSSLELQGKLQSLKQTQSKYNTIDANQNPYDDNANRDFNMNRIAGEVQQLELLASQSAAKTIAEDAALEVASQTYEIAGQVSLESRRDQQLVEIQNMQLEGKIVNVATPLLSSFVYRQIELENSSASAMMQGPATIYLNDRFVGGMEMPSTAVGQRFTVGLGADDQIRTRRELVNKVNTVQGGNQRIEFEYKLVISNFKPDSTAVRLLDRIPLPKQDREIKVNLESTSVPLSDDALYQRIDRPQNILRFEVDAAAGAFGSKALDITYKFTLELARNQSVTIPNQDAELRRDIENRKMQGGMGGGGFGGGGMF